MKKIRSLMGHPWTHKTRRIVRAVVVVCAVILAVAFVTTLTIDLGPSLRARAEQEGSRFMERPMHIGRLSVHLWRGRFLVEDLRIEGLTPESRPFLVAKRIYVSMPWETLFNRRIVFDTIEMTDWDMHVEMRPDGRHSFPKVTPRGPRGRSSWTTTVQYVRAHRGQFTYEDHGTPWSIVSRNLDVTVARTDEYRGQARFSNATVDIQNYVPFRADMSSSFTIDGGRVLFDRLDLETDGTKSALNGDVSLTHFPELMFRVQSQIHFPRMRELFFANDTFSLHGDGTFDGVFHLFRDVRPDGTSRTGRELKGRFHSNVAGVNDFRFPDLQGFVRWTPDLLEVRDAGARFYGGRARFEYLMAPLGVRGVPVRHRFDSRYENVNLTTFSNFLELEGIRLAGRASGRNLLEWPSGRWADRRGAGQVRLTPPDDVELMTRQMPVARAEAIARREPEAPFSNHTPRQPVPVAGALQYTVTPGWISLDRSVVATPDTYIEFEGRTAYGEQSKIPFHVSSVDWQESDRLFAGLMTAFGNRTNAIPIGGYGSFDGVMVGSFRRPRIEGTFTGERMRAFDVTWGGVTGSAVIENSYADVRNVVVTSGDSAIYTEGRFSLGFPRRDGGEEIDARIRLVRRPLIELRRAFGLEEYDVDGQLSGEFHVYGQYLSPLGFGRMAITDGVAYGEPFETAAANVRLEGDGVRLDSIEVLKGNGRGSGAAYVAWRAGTYSFNFNARSIPVESIAAARSSGLPLSGLVDFTAGGSGTFDFPRYDVRGTIRDFFIADEGIGEVVGEISIAGDEMQLELDAGSPRLAVTGSGRIALTPEMDAELSIIVADTSLDPYVRAFEPRLSPFTTAVASGSVRVRGQLANVDELVVDATVDRFDVSLFDYQLRNATPIRIALDRHSLRLAEMRLVGENTQLDVSGFVNLHDQRIAVRANGDANLGILQGFVSNIRSSGRATLAAAFEGALQQPSVTGAMTIDEGRIRHFALPHALENISGPVRFDARGVSLDEVTATLGGGAVQFGGRIDMEGYLPGRVDLSMTGENMRLRFPEGMRSVVDADLAVTGSVEAMTLSGNVTVRSAIYTRRFDGGGGLLDLAGSPAGVQGAGGGATLQATIPLRYDVQLNAPSTLRIENNQAQVQATADLQLRGTFDRPLLFGRAEIDRGNVTFEGRRYLITRGTIDFNNPTRIEPFFDIETETRVRVPGETYRITLRAAGTFDRLTPVFNADPPLPEVEILALLFSDVAPGQDVEFRQYSTDITPQQLLLRDRATRALTGAVSSEVGRVVEQTFGVDTFQLTPSLVDPNAQSSRLDPAARVTIGKRLSDRIYLTYSRSLSSSTRDQIILLEYDQTDRFSWILSRNEDRTYALDVRVRHAF